jgi:hypothetical protein
VGKVIFSGCDASHSRRRMDTPSEENAIFYAAVTSNEF